ncbi:MAG: hypothetical protein ACR2OO_11215, partial [Thermomicrobiales bacterium]
AVLSWKVERSIVRNAAGIGNSSVASGPNVANCVGALMESTGNISKQGAFLPGIPYRKGQGDVTSLVTSWIVNGDPNYGFVLKGRDETYSRNNAACISILANPRLTITYLHS